MPRLAPSLFRQAKRESPHLATLLPACRDIGSARNELRWLQSHIDENFSSRKPRHLERLVRQRGKGVPLQYVLGSQPFGALDIKCKEGVLIPRPETEAYTCFLIDLIKSGGLLCSRAELKENELKIIDFCTGTGCIPLLLFSSLQRLVKNLTVQGVDISPTAIQLAKENITRNIKLGNTSKPTVDKDIQIIKADVFSDSDIQQLANSRSDVLISNPPYISQDVWNSGRGQLGYSVRKYEPRLALIPDGELPRPAWCDPADVFYSRLLDVAALLAPKVILFEIGDESQARRVLQLYFRHKVASLSHVELWRDCPDLEPAEDEETRIEVATQDGVKNVVLVRGGGLLRSIFIRSLVRESCVSS
ncbi:S-adenosyl-L-methionine-dependent methyltransferase [Thelonectria olida]|uniref:peptide chain release factor N(5)-glutamine methyltransferase n=1 Tax=Thelonectria olida TaxID=1576542 RepID=A0A9P8W8E7_9HYPO|nr:S-adenosyl-L-methionine-dependent methyltransferase [Thelonectria olida]